MTIFATQLPSNSTQSYSDANRQCPAQQGVHPKLGDCHLRNGVNHLSSSSKHYSGTRRLAEYSTRHHTAVHSQTAHRHDASRSPLKGAANHNSVSNEGRATTKMVAMAAVVLSFSGKGATETRSRTSDFFQHQKTQPRIVTDKHEHTRDAMARGKNTRQTIDQKKTENLASQELKDKEVSDFLDQENVEQESSVLFQGRKNHDHFSNEGRKYKKHDSEGAKTPWHRRPQQLMASLSKVDCQPKEGDSADPLEPSLGRCSDTRSLRAKVETVGGEFGEHLKKEVYRMNRHKNWNDIISSRSHYTLLTERSKDLRFQIKEGIEAHQERKIDQQREEGLHGLKCEYLSESQELHSISDSGSETELDSDSLVDFELDEQYEEGLNSGYDEMQRTLSDDLNYSERMHKEHEDDVRLYELDIERQEYQDELSAQEAERPDRVAHLVYEAEQEELRSDITFDSIYTLAKGKVTL